MAPSRDDRALTRAMPADSLPVNVGMPSSAPARRDIHIPGASRSVSYTLQSVSPDHCSRWNNASQKIMIESLFLS